MPLVNFLLKLIPSKFFLIAGLVAAAGVVAFYIGHQNYTIKQLKLQVLTAETALEESQQHIDYISRNYSLAIESLIKEQKQAEQRARKLQEQRSYIDRAPDGEDGPVAPVLRETLRNL